MFCRLRYLIITGIAVCHGLWAQAPAAHIDQVDTPCALQRTSGMITLRAITQSVASGVYTLKEQVEIDDGVARLTADSVTYDRASGNVVADGHVAIDIPCELTHIESTHATYNVITGTGEFDHFSGVSGIRLTGREAAPMSDNPLIFSGERLLRTGEKHYRLEEGTLTSCALPDPKWTFTVSRADVELGGSATLYSAVFHLWQIPAFYAPYLTHSTERTGRHSGFLLPTVSRSTTKGDVLGDSFYWAAARNLGIDAGGDYYSARGWSDYLDLQSRPTLNSRLRVQLNGVFDRGVPGENGATIRQGGQELLVTGDHYDGSGFRSVINADFLSSYIYRLEFNNSFAQAINSQVISDAFTEDQFQGYDFSVQVHRYQDYLGTSPHTNLSLAALPAIDFNSYGRTLSPDVPLYFSWDINAAGLDRSQPGFLTGLMDRLDVWPQVQLPINTVAGNFTFTAEYRTTFYSKGQETAPELFLSPAGAAEIPVLNPMSLTRNAAIFDMNWHPPVLERIYLTPGGWLGNRVKHVIEPLLVFHDVSGVDNANNIIRYDTRDILSDTRELDYGVTNRLLAASDEAGTAREWLSWTLEQKYFFDPTFGGALVPGARNVFLTDVLLSPFAFETIPLRFSPLTSMVRFAPSKRFDADWRIDYDSHAHRVAGDAFTGTFHFEDGFLSASHYSQEPPPGLLQINAVPRYNQLRLSGGYGNADAPGVSLAAAVAFDAVSGQLQYTTVQTNYSWDCCGFSFAFRRFELASVRRENQYLISFTLSNVGTFGNLKRQSDLLKTAEDNQ